MQQLLDRAGITSRMTIVVLAAAIAAFAINMFFTADQQQAQEDAAETLSDAQAQLAQVQARVTAVREGASDSILAKYLKGRTLGMLLPDTQNNRVFETTLPQLMARNGLDTDGISRGTPSTANPQLQYLQYTMRVSGTLGALQGFLRDLRAYPQLTTTTVASLSVPSDTDVVTAQMSIRLYYSDQPPLEPLDDEPFPPYDYLAPLGQDVIDPDRTLQRTPLEPPPVGQDPVVPTGDPGAAPPQTTDDGLVAPEPDGSETAASPDTP